MHSAFDILPSSFPFGSTLGDRQPSSSTLKSVASLLHRPATAPSSAFILHNSSFILSQSPASDYARFTLYRCTKSVTYTDSCVFAQGYAYSEGNRRALTLINPMLSFWSPSRPTTLSPYAFHRTMPIRLVPNASFSLLRFAGVSTHLGSNRISTHRTMPRPA